MFQVFLSGRKTLVADVFVNGFGMNSGFKLMGDEGVAQIVDFSPFQAGFFKVAVDAGSDVSDQKRTTGFGDKQVVIFDFRP